MFANKNYERDIENTFALNRFFFRIVGMWPFARGNSLLELESVLVFACFILLLGEIIPALLYMSMIVMNIRVKLKVFGSTVFSTVGMLKYGFMVFYKSQIRNCLILIDEDWRNVVNPDDRISMIDKVRTGKRLVVMCAVFVYLGGMALRMFIPLSMGKIVTPQNVTIRPLPNQAHLVVLDVQRSPVYEIVYFVQVLGGFVKYTITVATFGFMTICVMHFCAQSDVLVKLMNDLVNESRSENLNKKLATVVEHQIKIRNFLQLVQSTFQYPSLMEVLGSSITICISGYFVITEWENQSIVRTISFSTVLIMVSFNVFIYCYMGEQIVEQGEKIALTTCTLEWHRLPDEKARALILLIIVSETPLKLKAGNIVDLSLRMFGNIVKMAVTYLNLLRSIE